VGDVAETLSFGRIRLEAPRQFVDEDVAVIYSVLSEKKIANYYHWVVEGLARAAMLEHAGVPNSVRLLVPQPVLEMHRTWLAAIGIDEERVLPWSGVPTRFRTVYLPSGPQHSGGSPIASAISFLRAHAARSRTAVPDRRLWISRRLARRRRKRMAGEADLLAVAANLGFEEIIAESLTAREQIELFAQAEAIAGPHGAGLANAVFMAPDTAVLEAAPESLKPQQKPLFWNLAAAAGQNYAYCVGPAEGIDPGRFERVLAKLLT
jgi:capsular polysaccharide biosynthesis protein